MASALVYRILPIFIEQEDQSTRRWVEGVHYSELSTPVNTPEITLWFWWGCPHCEQFSARLADWHNGPLAGADIGYEPVVGNAQRNAHAALYLATRHAGGADRLYQQMYQIIQQGQPPGQFLQTQAVDTDVIDQFLANEAPSVIDEQSQLAISSGVAEVPAVVINGKYRIEGKSLRSYDDFLPLITYLRQLP